MFMFTFSENHRCAAFLYCYIHYTYKQYEGGGNAYTNDGTK